MSQFIVSFIGIDHVDALESYAVHKMANVVDKFSLQPTKVEVNFSEETPNEYCCTVVLSGNHFKERFSEPGRYLFDCIDRLTEKLQSVLRKNKEQLGNLHRFRVSLDKQRWDDGPVADIESEFEPEFEPEYEPELKYS